MIDLRSDTLTQPTAGMRQAMASAPVGDDVFGEDPTVQALERRAAEVLGKEAAVYMPSGTMTNQVAMRAHTEPGDEVLLEGESHVYYYEVGAPAALAGVMCRFVPGERGIFTADDLRAAVRPRNIHYAVPKLMCIENTHNRGGGSVWPVERIAEVTAAARELGLRCHLDGARLWNASVATGVAEREYAAHFDTVSVCFSKGLGAPVGSALAGTREFIERARRFRKQFGGGMRQAGIIAAGALYALEHQRERLAEDHANARALADGIAKTPGLEVVGRPETNIVNLRVTTMSADAFAARLGEAGVRMLTSSPGTLRAVTHLNVSAAQMKEALELMRKAVAAR
jgi:threonine aldolase